MVSRMGRLEHGGGALSSSVLVGAALLSVAASVDAQVLSRLCPCDVGELSVGAPVLHGLLSHSPSVDRPELARVEDGAVGFARLGWSHESFDDTDGAGVRTLGYSASRLRLDAATALGDGGLVLRVERPAGEAHTGSDASSIYQALGTTYSLGASAEVGASVTAGVAWDWGETRIVDGRDVSPLWATADGGWRAGIVVRQGRGFYGVSMSLPRAAHRLCADVGGLLLDSPLTSGGRSATAYAGWRRGETNWAVELRVSGMGTRQGRLVDAAGFDRGSVAASTSSIGLIAAARHASHSTEATAELGVGMWQGAVEGELRTLPSPALLGGRYTLTGSLVAPWVHTSIGVRRSCGSRASVSGGIRADIAWPAGRVHLTDTGTLIVPPETVMRWDYTSAPGLLLTPTLGATCALGDAKLAAAIAWPLPMAPKAAYEYPPPTQPPRVPKSPPVVVSIEASVAF